MASILKAIASGFPSRTVLNHLIRKYPHMANAVNTAHSLGYTSDLILRHLNKDNHSDEDAYLTEHEQVQKRDRQQKKRAGLQLLAMAGTAGAVAAGGIGYLTRNRAIRPNAILPALPPGGGGPPGPVNPQPQGGGPLGPIIGGAAVAQALQPGQPTQQPPQQQSPIAAANRIRNLNLVRNTRTDAQLAKIINDSPNIVAAAELARQVIPESKLNFLEKTEGGIEQILKDFTSHLQENPQEIEQLLEKAADKLDPTSLRQQFRERYQTQQPQDAKEAMVAAQPETQLPVEQQQMVQQPLASLQATSQEPPERHEERPIEASRNMIAQPPGKGEIVSTPQGPGEVKAIHGNNAYVEVDNKLQKIPLESLEEPDQDVRQIVDEILKIPEVDRSSNISLFTYDPTESTIYIQFHNGETYKYLDVPKEAVDIIATKNAVPVTSGQNIFGAWSPDDKKSLGAAFYNEIRRNPKYAVPKKGEPENPNYKKLDTLYDYFTKLRKKPKRKKKEE